MKTPFSRRRFLKTSTLAAGAGFSLPQLLQPVAANLLSGDDTKTSADHTSPPPATVNEVSLRLLDGEALLVESGVSFGVPWPKGSVKRDATFSLTGEGKQLPLQSWPLAYWPDGSLKWSGFATVVPAGLKAPLTLSQGSSQNGGALKVTRDGDSMIVDTGALKCVISTTGANIFASMSVADRAVVGNGQLVCILQNGPNIDPEDAPPRERLVSVIKKVTAEQTGPVRAVVKFEGTHKGVKSGREWLPFTVRLYFYSGQTAVRMVHTITFDGDQEKDFVRGLGVRLEVPLREEPRNRTVRFVSSEGGVWSEPLQPGGGSVAQETGQPFSGRGEFAQNAIWDDFKLAQPNPEGFIITKRTNPKSTWLFSAAGKRASGFGFVGDLTGGLGVSVKNFWQSHPASLEIRHASQPVAE